MLTSATRHEHYTATHATEPVWLLAFELREKTWQLGCTTGQGQKPRARCIAARHQARLLPEVAQAQRRCDLPDPAPGVRCDATGRAGFWLSRFLPALGLANPGVDSAAIEVHRRQRRAKSAQASLNVCRHFGMRQDFASAPRSTTTHCQGRPERTRWPMP